MAVTRRIPLAAAALVSVLALSACGSVSSAVDSAQNAVDSAQGVVDQAAGLASVATEIASACAAAQAAWIPGVSTADAEAALADAADSLRGALDSSPVEVPGAGAVRDALDGAQQALRSDTEAFGLSQDTLRTACAVFTAGG